MPMDRALRRAGCTGRVVHHGVVIHRRRLDGELCGGLCHQRLVAEVPGGQRIERGSTFVDDDDVFERQKRREYTGDAFSEFWRGHERDCSAIGQAIPDGVRAECREQGPGDCAHLEGPEQRDVLLGDPIQEEKDPVSLGDTETPEDVGELVGLRLEVAKTVTFLNATL